MKQSIYTPGRAAHISNKYQQLIYRVGQNRLPIGDQTTDCLISTNCYRVGQNRLPIKVPIQERYHTCPTYPSGNVLYVAIARDKRIGTLIGSLFWPTLYISRDLC